MDVSLIFLNNSWNHSTDKSKSVLWPLKHFSEKGLWPGSRDPWNFCALIANISKRIRLISCWIWTHKVHALWHRQTTHRSLECQLLRICHCGSTLCRFALFLATTSDPMCTKVTGRRISRYTCHAFVSNRVDYCCSLLAGSSKVVTDRFQQVLYAAARVITNTGKYDKDLHYTVRHDLHWLDMTERVQFRIATTVYRCLHGGIISLWTVFSSKRNALRCHLQHQDINSGHHGVIN